MRHAGTSIWIILEQHPCRTYLVCGFRKPPEVAPHGPNQKNLKFQTGKHAITRKSHTARWTPHTSGPACQCQPDYSTATQHPAARNRRPPCAIPLSHSGHISNRTEGHNRPTAQPRACRVSHTSAVPRPSQIRSLFVEAGRKKGDIIHNFQKHSALKLRVEAK